MLQDALGWRALMAVRHGRSRSSSSGGAARRAGPRRDGRWGAQAVRNHGLAGEGGRVENKAIRENIDSGEAERDKTEREREKVREEGRRRDI
jgi:hypothetical protein